MDGLKFPTVGAELRSGCIMVELSMRLPSGGRNPSVGKRASPSVDARGASRSPFDGMRGSKGLLIQLY